MKPDPGDFDLKTSKGTKKMPKYGLGGFNAVRTSSGYGAPKSAKRGPAASMVKRPVTGPRSFGPTPDRWYRSEFSPQAQRKAKALQDAFATRPKKR
jgi:hypothetical protein